MVTVAPGTPASLASVTVPVMDPVMPCPNAVGCDAKARINNKLAKRAHQIDLCASGIALSADGFGISNKVFIASPFLRCLSNGIVAYLSWPCRRLVAESCSGGG